MTSTAPIHPALHRNTPVKATDHPAITLLKELIDLGEFITYRSTIHTELSELEKTPVRKIRVNPTQIAEAQAAIAALHRTFEELHIITRK